MSLTPRRIDWGKHCFVYCGPARCNCGASADPIEWAERRRKENEVGTMREQVQIETDFDKASER